MAIVYSYVRFSSKRQEHGDSFRRQVQLRDDWIERNNHTLASLTLNDLGVSAYRGKNKHQGALSKFLDAIERGRVKPGNILLIENLDRLSRQGVDEAFELFKRILKAGVHIAVLRPYETVYTEKSLNDIIGMLLPLLAFHLAHLESKNKSDRISDQWKKKRKDFESGQPIDQISPSWITLNLESRKFELNDGAKAIKFIFSKTAEGYGQRQVLGLLQKSYKPIGRSGTWHSSFIQKVLNDRSVLGERQNYTFDDEGNRIPIGDPLPYYPPVIDETLWYRAQSKKAEHKKLKGPSSQFINLFTGLLYNAHDGQPMYLATTRHKRKTVQRRLISYGHQSKQEGSDPVSVLYDQFETVVLAYLNEINPEDLESGVSMTELKEKEQELSGIVGRLNELQAELEQPGTGVLRTVLAAISKLEERRETVAKEVEELKQDLHSDQPLSHAQEVLAILANADAESIVPLRIRLRSSISELVDKIYIKPEKHYGRVYALAQIFFKTGLMKGVHFGPGFVGGTRWQIQDALKEYTVDLRDREAANSKMIFTKLAKLLIEPAEVVVPTNLPSTLGDCGEHWLTITKGTLSAQSFRMIPAKIRRFSEFIGVELSVGEFSRSHWALWVRSLRLQVKDGSLAHNTARVTYSRTREFVRWMIANKLTPEIAELEISGEKALVG